MEVKGDGSDLNLQRRLGRSNGSYVYEENLIDSLLRCEPTEIAEDEFKLLKKTRLDLPSSMPGGVYRVKQWPNSSPPSSTAFALPAA